MRHTCDEPSCINPDHLVIGTNADNMQDKVDRDRQSKGTDFKTAKLTDANVKYIKNNTVKGSSTMGYKAMAEKFDVSITVVSHIMKGLNWKHI